MSDMRKKFISALLALVMTVGLASGVLADTTKTTKETPLVPETTKTANFTDVQPGNWAYGFVNRVVADSLYSGTGAGKFSPGVVMTRGMIVLVLAKLDGAALDNSAASPFTDVPAGNWYTGAVSWAASKNLVSGYGNGKFGPDDQITRQQLATILMNYLDTYKKYTVKEDPKIASFKDINTASSYAKESIEYCRIHGLSAGYADGTFRPLAGITRAEVAAMLCSIIIVTEESTNPAGGGSSGGGGGNPTTTTKYYGIEAKGQKDRSATYQYDLWYNTNRDEHSITGNTTLLSAVKDLYTVNGNDTAIKNYFGKIIEKAANSGFTAKHNSDDITFTISAVTNGKVKISAVNKTQGNAVVNLSDELNKADNKFDGAFYSVFNKLVSHGIAGTDGNKNLVRALYNLFKPSCFVKTDGNDFVSLTADGYLGLIDARVNALEACRNGLTVSNGKNKATVFESILTSLYNEGTKDGISFSFGTSSSAAVIKALAETAAMSAPTMDDLYNNLGKNLTLTADYTLATAATAYSGLSHFAQYCGRDISEYENVITQFIQSAMNKGANGTYHNTFTINQHN
jgi:hypothetical protein